MRERTGRSLPTRISPLQVLRFACWWFGPRKIGRSRESAGDSCTQGTHRKVAVQAAAPLPWTNPNDWSESVKQKTLGNAATVTPFAQPEIRYPTRNPFAAYQHPDSR